MKKYMKLISVAVMIVVIYTVFFISGKEMTASFPQIKFHHIEGDASLVESLAIFGSINTGNYFFDETFKYDKSGTTYEADLPWLERLDGFSSEQMERLNKKYPSFMRGKDNYDSYFFESDEIVAYVGFSSMNWEMAPEKFEVHLLDRASEQVKKLTVDIPDVLDYWYLDIRNVYYEDGKIFVTTVNYKEDAVVSSEYGNYAEEVVIYTFDMENEQLENTTSIHTVNALEDDQGFAYANVLVADKDKGSLYLVDSNEIYSEDGSSSMKLNKVMHIDVASQKKKEIKVEKEVKGGVPVQADAKDLYFLQDKDGKAALMKYNVENGEMISKLIFDEGLSYDDAQGSYIEVINGELYYIPTFMYNDDTAKIAVLDTNTLDKKYVGELTVENRQQINEFLEIYINEAYIKE